jgi:hypothetical protein
VKRVRAQWFGAQSPFQGRADLGISMRGVRFADDAIVTTEYQFAREM